MNRLLLLLILLFNPVLAAVDFPGYGGTYLTCGTTNHPQNNEAQTWALWLKIDSPTGSRQEAISMGGAGGVLSMEIDSSGNLNMEEYGGADFLSYAVPDTGWHHWAFVYNATTNYLYLDGVQVDSDGDSHPANTTYSLLLSSYIGFTYLSFNGQMDHVLFYDRALTAAEVASLALSKSKLLITDGLVAGYRMDSGLDNTSISGSNAVKDFSINGNHCSPVGTITWRASTWINYP